MTNNPYVVAHLTLSGPDYHGEIRTVPVNDVDTSPERLTDTALHMFLCTFPALDCINEAIRRIGDRSLEAETWHHQGISMCIETNGEQHIHLEHEHQQLELDLGMCVHRLQEA